MDPGNIPFNALIVGPSNSGKTQFFVKQLCGPFNGEFDYIVLICPTFAFRLPAVCHHLRAAPCRSLAKSCQFLFQRHQHSNNP